MSTVTEATPAEDRTEWYRLSAIDACRRLGVDRGAGLTTADVTARRAKHGPNRLAQAAKEPGWKAFLRQYRDLMQLVLVGAAAVSIVALQDVSTGLVVLALTVINAVMGLHQEGKAAESVAALSKMLIMTAHVRRDGQVSEVPAEDLVPGDVVSFEAGDKVPADGRILVAATLEIEEAGLTGESTPVLKTVDPVDGVDVALGDRVDMAYMNSQVTRGRGEMVVTATGMATEVGHISGMLSGVEQEKTPLTKQLDQLTVLITIMAAGALIAIVLLGLARGEDFDSLFLVGISLAIAAIPTGLPAVVTMLLSMGTQQLADKGAIVKRLRSVETLGSTSAICSDKTGTLTLNQMTARALVVAGRRFDVDGEGYSTQGRIMRVAGSGDGSLEPFLLPMALANDAVIRDGACIGDPTEGALVVLAEKGGLDVDETRRTIPRLAEVPFDAEYKLMATFHELHEDGRRVVRCLVKGAPDVLLARSSRYLAADGTSRPLAEGADGTAKVLAENDRLAGEGMRVLAVARRDLERIDFDETSDLLGVVADLEFLALVGIVDPPRKEARDAIAECRRAGIRVRMITGDHATTAAAIAGQLGIEGRALTGAEFAALSDEQLHREVDGIGVVARVAPEDKVRLVAVLKDQGNVVAMTGDGVNDAPALTRADIGVAMGITGTEVTKDAAEMILTDDNFATIVAAVEGGRGLYDNLMKYVRVQMIMLAGFILTFLGAGIFTIANGTPLLPLQILWINFAIDVLLAVGLGFDQPTPGLMDRRPRPPDEPVIRPALGVRLALDGLLIAIGALVVVAVGENQYDLAVATTMGLVATSLLHIVAALEWRDPLRTIFTRDTLANGRFVRLMLVAGALTFVVTAIGALQRIFDTVELTSAQWGICLLAPLGYLVLAEIEKLVVKR
ncbi:cation-transporting P-type ATPase [Jiangella sp. DSM 45060]|uniref:cation-translocating P-type ATPase n=1 Tax=Jiangella sp. DSM 45060 TaxID=1798224 RepID=UPI00087C7DB1|nr:cation-transporting P-type ATPase [Jiangella sp. DSM 45060]SDT09994.1 Ca2+-transporting ATPase [Jiangella sp. DSM 45060]